MVNRAQGTIEYLVIIAVVVVISLVVVALVITTTSAPSQQIKDSSSKLGSASSGGISIVEAVVDPNGDSLIKFSNNSNDVVYLNKVSVGSVDNNYDDSRRQLVGLDSKTFSLSGLSSVCPCANRQKSVNCEFRIEYLTSTGLTKTEYKNIKVECVTDSIPVDDTKVIDPVVVVLEFGTLANPWIINDCNELQDMNNHLDGNYILGEDIDCYTETHAGGILYNGGLGFSPIGTCGPAFACFANNYSYTFRGNLEGNNKKISNLYMYREQQNYAGLFGVIRSSTISNIGLIDSNITGKGYVGGLVGYNSYSEITNCYATGYTTGTGNYVGGLIGFNNDGSTIMNCYATGDTTGIGSSYVGGLVGRNFYSTIKNCYAIGDTIGYYKVGGLVGENTGYSTITNSYATGHTNGDYYVGGLTGHNDMSELINCYATGDTIGIGNVGGLTGYNYDSEITNCYATGYTTGNYTVGGLTGENMGYSTIMNSYWDVSRTNQNYCYGTGAYDYCIGKNLNNSDPNAFFSNIIGSDYNVPMQHNSNPANDWTFGVDKNWVVVTGSYPILSWQ